MRTRFFTSSLFLSIVALFGIGLMQVYSASYVFATESYGDGLYFFKRQLTFTFLAAVVILVTTQIPFNLIKKWSWAMWPISFVLLLATFIPGIGVRVGGALRWIQLPGGVRFEPSEIAKVAFCFLFASLVCRKENMLGRFKWGWIAALILLPLGILNIQHDFGSLVIITLVAVALLFTFGMQLKWLVAAGFAALPLFYFAIWSYPYRRARIEAFLDPWSDPAKKGFQVIQSMLSVHSGGISGVGLGQGQGKLFFLPEAHTDFTMAVFFEEMGFIGVVAILALYGFVVFKGFQIAIKVQDVFKRTLVLGLITTFAFSVFINIGVVLGLVPTKGLTMPFMSYGGSSLLVLSFLFGIILNIEMSENQSKPTSLRY
ncbi:MAG: cell division protein FtsW [Pseudobdellovibrio sp.]|jgi:cell division protein FtsW|nr:cell division protein FtsW [Pseudobdellovibrio sp.]